MMKKCCRLVFAIILSLVGLLFFLYPALFSTCTILSDSGLRTGGPTELSFKLHKTLSKKLPSYIDSRIDSKIATTLTFDQIEATEWPLFGAFFYLRATEQLQKQWEADPSLAKISPRELGEQAIAESARLLLDPNHAHWVELYWGKNHLKAPNCFYRMLLLGGLSSHHKLTNSEENFPFMRTIMEDIAADLDASPHGLIDDYPQQCFPADVIAAIAMIKATAECLGEDRSQWASSALDRLLKVSENKLPPYTASAITGQAATSSRGCTNNGFALPHVREINPPLASKLYQESVERFWKKGFLASGWREFPKDVDLPNLYFDPDSGPVLFEFGTSATGLGLGVARAYGDENRSSLLASQLLATAFPLPNGRLLIPSLVANKQHAPYFPEIVLMYQLSQTNPSPSEKGPIPALFWIIITIQLIIGTLLLRGGFRQLKKALKTRTP